MSNLDTSSGVLRSDIHDISTLDLVNYKGTTISLLNIFTEISIHESIFMPVCSGYITILESDNLFEDLPVTGEETLNISYAGLHSDIIDRTFYVYSIESIDDEYGSATAHTLKFCSHEVMRNKSQRISRAFTKLSPNDIVKKILKKDLNSNKDIYVEKASNTVNYIAPNITPFAVISQIATRSHSSTVGAGGLYLFYEDADGYNFRSIESLFDEAGFNYSITDQGLIDNILKDDSIVLAHSYDNLVNTVEGISSGTLGNNFDIIDLDSKKVVKAGFNYFDDSDFARVKRISGETDRHVSNKFNKSNLGITAVLVGTDNAKDLTIGQRQNRIATISNGPRLNVEVPINIAIRAGSIINMTMPSKLRDDKSIPSESEFVSGKYIATSVRQIFYQHSGVTVMALTKDGIGVNSNKRFGL